MPDFRENLKMSQKIAHVKQNADGSWSPAHKLYDHLQSVAERSNLVKKDFLA